MSVSQIPSLDLDAIEESEPACTFILGAHEWRVRSPQDMAWSGVEKMMAAGGDDPEKSVIQIREFFQAVLFPDDVAPFLEMLDKEQSKVTLKRVELLTRFVTEKVFPGHPTTGQSDSSPGSETVAPTSTASSTWPDISQKPSPRGQRSQSSTPRGRSSATTRSSKTA